jgi:DNA invertase Pin-like site-specific DNA recombinase
VYARSVSQGFASRQRQQQDSVSKLTKSGEMRLSKWITEIERGRSPKWPELKRAAEESRASHAVVVVAGLNRFAYDVELLSQLDKMMKDGSFSHGLLFADLPNLGIITQANRSALSVLVAAATFESQFDRERSRYRQGPKGTTGKKHGGLRPSTQRRNKATRDVAIAVSEELRAHLEPLFQEGTTYREMAKVLHQKGVKTRSGEALSPSQIRRHLQRLGLKT